MRKNSWWVVLVFVNTVRILGVDYPLYGDVSDVNGEVVGSTWCRRVTEEVDCSKCSYVVGKPVEFCCVRVRGVLKKEVSQ
jgi:hypothetical protein